MRRLPLIAMSVLTVLACDEKRPTPMEPVLQRPIEAVLLTGADGRIDFHYVPGLPPLFGPELVAIVEGNNSIGARWLRVSLLSASGQRCWGGVAGIASGLGVWRVKFDVMEQRGASQPPCGWNHTTVRLEAQMMADEPLWGSPAETQVLHTFRSDVTRVFYGHTP